MFRRLSRIVGVIDDEAAWRRDAISAQNLFCLVLVDFHRARRFITAAVLLLGAAAARAQIRDGNLIEYGLGGFSDGATTLMLQAPDMKIFRDGRVLIVDRDGQWQGRIDEGRVAKLERDLAAAPLLQQKSRFVDFKRRKPILMHGGLSYIRFRDGDDAVVLAASGIPLDREWNAIVDRVKSERPSTLTSFHPRALTLLLWDMPANLSTSPTDAWPFTATLPLAGHGSNTLTTADPAIVAFILDHANKLVREGDSLYGFMIEAAAGWYEITPLQLQLFGLWSDARHGRGAAVEDENLIEYGMGGFADGAIGPPMLYPPEVKIYADGRIVFAEKDGYWQGRIEPKRLERLQRDLANNALLKKSQLLRVTNGSPISLHGGMAYVRYRDGDDEVVVAVPSHPRRGPYPRLLDRIRQEIPATRSRFRPSEITFTLYKGAAWVEPVPWPFSAATPLCDTKDPITIRDPAAIAFVIDRSFGGFSWMQTNVTDNGVAYSIILRSAPGWYDPDALAFELEELRLASR